MRGWIPTSSENQDHRYLPIFLNVFLLALLRVLESEFLGLESFVTDLVLGVLIFQDT